jgi:proteasome lid subunit RPN8/RPN11
MKPRAVLDVPAAVRRAIIAHAERDRPRECCGLLAGRRRHVRLALPMRNVARGTRRFRMNDAEHIAVRRVLRELTPGLDIVGVYHSHPAGRAWPSPTDVAEAHYPEWAHIIVGLGTRRPVLRAFRITNGRVAPLRLRYHPGFQRGRRVSSRGASTRAYAASR